MWWDQHILPKVLTWDYKVIIVGKEILNLCWSLILPFCIQNTVDTVHCLWHVKLYWRKRRDGKTDMSNEQNSEKTVSDFKSKSIFVICIGKRNHYYWASITSIAISIYSLNIHFFNLLQNSLYVKITAAR